MNDCLFCKIIAGEIPCYKVWEDGKHIAFLDIRPIAEGHTLVMPKTHAPYLFALPDDAYRALHAAAKTVATILKEKTVMPRVVEVVEGFEVDHVHLHLIPMDRGFVPDDFHRAGEPDHAALAATLDKIREV
jgi:histidine triad (HIT) family protein